MIRRLRSIKEPSILAVAGRFRFWAGVVTAILFSVALYLFLCWVLAVVPYIQIPRYWGYAHGPWLELHWNGFVEPVRPSYLAYLFLASFSLAVGMGVALRIWFVHRGVGEAALGRHRRRWVRTETSFAPWLWSLWVLEFGFVAVIAVIFVWADVYRELGSEGVWEVAIVLSILLPLALFFQLWNSPRLTVRTGRLMAACLLILVIIAPLLALLRPHNPDQINDRASLDNLSRRIHQHALYHALHFNRHIGHWPDAQELYAMLTLPELSADQDTLWVARLGEHLRIDNLLVSRPDTTATILINLSGFPIGHGEADIRSTLVVSREYQDYGFGRSYIESGTLRAPDQTILVDISGAADEWHRQIHFAAHP